MPADKSGIQLRNKILTAQNDNWRSYFQDLADFCLPRKAWMTTIKFKGERLQFNYLYDSTAIRGLKTMAAGFHSNLTNPLTKWFALEALDKKLMEDKTVQMWFYECTEILLQSLNTSNFDTSMQEWYMDFGGFGTATMLQLEDRENRLRFTTIPIDQVNLEEDANGRVIAVYRNFKLSAMQAFMLWGEKAGELVCKLIEKDDKAFTEVEFLHYCGPRDRFDHTKKDAMNMPIESVWIEKKSSHLIHESGFRTMPYHVARFWKDYNDCFGYAPTMDVLADIKLVNAMQRTILRAAMKATDPPLQMPSRGFILPLNLNPAALNYRLEGTNADALAPLPVNQGNIPISIEILKMIQENIEEGLFVPLFKALSQVNKQMTVPEVQRRILENMVLLGPVVGRTTHEFLDPLITRAFYIHYENGWFPEAPQAIQNRQWKSSYLGPLAMAQRESELNKIEGFLGSIASIAQVKPQTLDRIDEDKTVDLIARIKGVSPEILRDPNEVLKIRQARQQAQAAQMQLQAAEQGAKVAKDGAKAAHDGAKAEEVSRK